MAVNHTTLDLAQRMKHRVDDLTDATTRALVAAWADAWAEIVAEWDAAVQQIVAARNVGVVGPGQIARMDRAQRALQATAEALEELSAGMGDLTAGPLAEVIAVSEGFTERITQSQLPTGARVSWNRVSPDELAHITDRATQAITSPTIPLSVSAMDAVRSTLLRAVPAGWGPDRAAREMLARTQGAFNGGLTRAMTIARTELLDAHRYATQAAERANPDTVAGWVWLATLDAKTCPSCWANHGTEHESDEPGPLDHQCGRCTRLTKTKTWADLGFPGIEEPDDLTPNRDTAWDALTTAEQRQVLGPARYDLFSTGQVGWGDLTARRTNDGWRDSFHTPPLSDLVGG